MSHDRPVGFEELAGGVRRSPAPTTGPPDPPAPDPEPPVPAPPEASTPPEAPASKVGLEAWLGYEQRVVAAKNPAAPASDAPLPSGVSAPPAAGLSAEVLLRQPRSVPESGWRRAVYKASGGRVNPGNSSDVVERRVLEDRARARITGDTRFVAVVSRKGGVGKTTATVTLGMELARLRPDRVAAIDANPDRGTLASRAPRNTQATVLDLVASAAEVTRFPAMSSMVNRDPVTGLDVIASESDPHKARAFGAKDYKTVADVLSGFYNLVLTDCGTDFTHEVLRAILDRADALVVMSGAGVEEAQLADETLDLAEAMGYHHLARDAVVVVREPVVAASAGPDVPPVDVNAIVNHFQSRARAVVRFPVDAALARGHIVDLERLAPRTRRAILQLAAEVIDGLGGSGTLPR